MKKTKIYIGIVQSYLDANPSFLQSFLDKGYEVALFIEDNGGKASDISEKQRKEMYSNADVIISCVWPVTKEMMDASPNLKIIANFGVGINHIDMEEATRRGIYVTSARGGSAVTVAEHAIGLMISVARKQSLNDRDLHNNRWDNVMGSELTGKTLGILGMGNIAERVAYIGKNGFDMQIIAYDPYINEDYIRRYGVEYVSLEELFAKSDFLSIHTPLTDGTKALVGAELLNSMKESAVLVNLSRGGVVDEEALYDVLKNKKIKGAGIDVYAKEPISEDNPNPFGELDNAVTTCHLGASSVEAVARICEIIQNNIADVLEGKQPRINWMNRF